VHEEHEVACASTVNLMCQSVMQFTMQIDAAEVVSAAVREYDAVKAVLYRTHMCAKPLTREEGESGIDVDGAACTWQQFNTVSQVWWGQDG